MPGATDDGYIDLPGEEDAYADPDVEDEAMYDETNDVDGYMVGLRPPCVARARRSKALVVAHPCARCRPSRRTSPSGRKPTSKVIHDRHPARNRIQSPPNPRAGVSLLSTLTQALFPR